MRNYKEMAKAMREETLKYRNGVLEVPVELWEEIADALEKKPQGGPILELIYNVVAEQGIEIRMERDRSGGMMVKVRKDGTQMDFVFEPEPMLVITAEEDFFWRLRRAREQLLENVRRRELYHGQTIGADTEA